MHKHLDKRSKMHNDATIRANVPWRPCIRTDVKMSGERENMKEIAFFVNNACALDVFPRSI